MGARRLRQDFKNRVCAASKWIVFNGFSVLHPYPPHPLCISAGASATAPAVRKPCISHQPLLSSQRGSGHAADLISKQNARSPAPLTMQQRNLLCKRVTFELQDL